MPNSPVINLADLTLRTQAHGSRFEVAVAPVAAAAGAHRLGSRLCVVPAGKRAWPYHCHHANDEMFVILEGSGTLRFGGEEFPVKAGEVVVCPSGGPETAHQLIAGPDGPLRYLAISTMNEPDVMEYPDSGKIATFAGSAPGGAKGSRRVALVARAADGVDYWDGEAAD
ncbi:cupin domain-containing protein [Acuticoccus kandeliae]|uniref:cupin domain-containing protein n=1 Tax=Acuticoccus kandeliae TaxID=2073160 RepID=UPI000D3ECB54|nr:cupin domain-containing protein [Acuticoccus kandeliae]